MESSLFVLLLCTVSVWSATEPCLTRQFTASGECCKACNIGEGMIQPCGINQTVCETCIDSTTYSDTVSHTESCKPCTVCLGLKRIVAPCVETDDAVCACNYGYYLNKERNECEPCQSCGLGFGMMYPCSNQQDTMCESCPTGTFSDIDSSMDPCMPCKFCEDGESLLEDCTPMTDTVCHAVHPRWTHRTPSEMEPEDLSTSTTPDPLATHRPPTSYDPPSSHHPPSSHDLPPFHRPPSSPDLPSFHRPPFPHHPPSSHHPPYFRHPPSSHHPLSSHQPPSFHYPLSSHRPPSNRSYEASSISSTVTATTNTIMGSSQPIVTRGIADNLIPIYCSILAAVVVGLVAFIVFKRWNSCKQNKPRANNHPVNQTPSPEGEKLHSDSGISVDSQSLHDQQSQPQIQALKGGTHVYTSLSPTKQEEVEKLLNGSMEDTWRSLAGELGYKDDLIDTFTQEEHPVRALLSDWSGKDSATMEVLCSALRKIQREDIVESLYSESTATSPV
uniref:Tumor necrosis factor receptor superfamily member 16-like n=1 Tax=Geotrypetes seraphini TaxID=260995 RepID=A0A6P8PCL3_GEOSA|nr:tumor necrosis factor receptor superfamily member 16-like [Geotrypetes seraphini]